MPVLAPPPATMPGTGLLVTPLPELGVPAPGPGLPLPATPPLALPLAPPLPLPFPVLLLLLDALDPCDGPREDELLLELEEDELVPLLQLIIAAIPEVRLSRRMGAGITREIVAEWVQKRWSMKLSN